MHRVCVTDFTAAALAKQGPKPYGAMVVKRVGMVAALITGRDGGYVLRANDDAHMAAIIEQGPKMGAWFAPDLEVGACNIRYQQDFLSAAKGKPVVTDVDALVFSYVFYNRKGEPNAIDKTQYHQSQHAFEPDVWYTSTMVSGAPIVINIRGLISKSELPTDLILKDPYTLVGQGLPVVGSKVMDVLVRQPLINRLRAA